ncbi:hypothetical protein JR334_06420 [Clostridia bacterium]|nr:hypothetical protein JR334_06420 [Clostridia bacterium]
MEQENKYPITTNFSYFNQDGILKPYGYQHLLAQLVDRHLEAIGMNMESTMKYGLGWVLRSITIDIKEQIPRGFDLVGKTWYAQRKGPYFRREYQLYDREGNLLLNASSYSILLDLKNRTIFRQHELPFSFQDPTEILLLDAKPSFKAKGDYGSIQKRCIRASHIDGMGHVNNCRYGEFAYDSLPVHFRDNLNQLKHLEFYFQAEMKQEDTFTMEQKVEQSEVFLRGVLDGNTKSSFDVIMGFQS